MMLKSRETGKMPMNLQFFAEGSGEGGEGNGNQNNNAGNGNSNPNTEIIIRVQHTLRNSLTELLIAEQQELSSRL